MPAAWTAPSLRAMTTGRSSIRVQAPKARPGGRSGTASGAPPTYLTPARLLALAVALAAVIAGVLIGVSVAGSGASGSPRTIVGAASTGNLLGGIPEHGSALGSPTAPVTLVEFADPACPYCGKFAVQVLPSLVRTYIRTGKVRLVYNGLAFVGPASDRAVRAIVAAGEQNRAWYVIDTLYRNQGDETTNWVPDSYLRAVGNTVPGLDTAKMMRDMDSAGTTAAIRASSAKASSVGVHQTPTIFAGTTGGTLQEAPIQSLAQTVDTLLTK